MQSVIEYNNQFNIESHQVPILGEKNLVLILLVIIILKNQYPQLQSYKLYYGCKSSEIKLLLSIIKIEISNIILYGNYNSADVAYFLNYHNIYKGSDQWTSISINKVINQNCEYINKKYNLVDNFINELKIIIYKNNISDISKNVRTINQLFLEINGYKLTEKLEKYKLLKTKWDIKCFLNTYIVNFRTWVIDDIEDIQDLENDEPISNKSKYN